MAYGTYKGQSGRNFRPNSDMIHESYDTKFNYDTYDSGYEKMIMQQTGLSFNDMTNQQYHGYREEYCEFN